MICSKDNKLTKILWFFGKKNHKKLPKPAFQFMFDLHNVLSGRTLTRAEIAQCGACFLQLSHKINNFTKIQNLRKFSVRKS
jgi:hypothetical protein